MLPSKIFFDDFFNDLESPKISNKIMKCDIYEEAGNYIVEMDIPGFDKKDINLEYEDGYLKVKVEKNTESNEEEKKYVHRERKSYQRYERSFYIGSIEEDQVKAKFNNGILKITIPKIEKKEQRKIIEIEN